MRKRTVLAVLLVVGLTVLGMVGPVAVASAQEETPASEEELTHEAEECIKLLEEGKDIDACQEAPSPILPATNELVWGSISFVALFLLLWRFAFPAIRSSMEGRAERIRSTLEEAEQTKAEAQSILAEYQAKLADARSESARIIEEARQAADQLRQDLRRQAEAEVAASKQRAQEEIEAAVARATADLRVSVRELTLDLAEKVVERNLDRDTNLALIDRFIDEVGASRT
jgi:F-type H+-transporting ATPase subunit b